MRKAWRPKPRRHQKNYMRKISSYSPLELKAKRRQDLLRALNALEAQRGGHFFVRNLLLSKFIAKVRTYLRSYKRRKARAGK